MSSKRDEVCAALQRIVSQEGPNCLRDINRFRGLWMDYAPQNSKEAKLILWAVQDGVGGTLLSAIGKDDAGQRQCIMRCERALTEAGIAEDKASFAVRQIATALKIDVDRIMPPPVSSEPPQNVTPQSIKPPPEPQSSAPECVVEQVKEEPIPSKLHYEAEPLRQGKLREEFASSSVGKESQRKRKFPWLLLLLVFIGGMAAAGMLLPRDGSTVPPPVDAQDDLIGAVPPLVEKPEPEPDPETVVPAVLPVDDESEESSPETDAAVLPVYDAEQEEPPAEQPVTTSYEIDTVVANLYNFRSMVLDNQNNLYYIDGQTVYCSKSETTLDLSDVEIERTYLAHDPYNDNVYLLTATNWLEIYDITDLESPELVLSKENCPALYESRCNSLAWCSSVTPQIVVLANGALLLPFGDDSLTWMVNISDKTVTRTTSIYRSYCKVVDDKLMYFRGGDRIAAIADFAATSNQVEVELDVEAPYNNCNSVCAKYGMIYFYLDSVGVCGYDTTGAAYIVIPQESIKVKDYQSLDYTNIWSISVGSPEQIAFYDNSLNCIRLIQQTSSN